MARPKFNDLEGQTIVKVEQTDRYGNDAIVFTIGTGKSYILTHYQDCCEDVYIESIDGNLNGIVDDGPVLLAEEVSKDDPEASESGTWTFFKIRTHNWDVVIRFYGSSNGYYSESAGFSEIRT